MPTEVPDRKFTPPARKGYEPWTSEEDAMLRQRMKELPLRKSPRGLKITGWAKICRGMGRSAKQVRNRVLGPTEARGGWKKKEDAVLVETYAQVGDDWAKIAKKLPGRSRSQVRRRHAKLASTAPESTDADVGLDPELSLAFGAELGLGLDLNVALEPEIEVPLDSVSLFDELHALGPLDHFPVAPVPAPPAPSRPAGLHVQTMVMPMARPVGRVQRCLLRTTPVGVDLQAAAGLRSVTEHVGLHYRVASKAGATAVRRGTSKGFGTAVRRGTKRRAA